MDEERVIQRRTVHEVDYACVDCGGLEPCRTTMTFLKEDAITTNTPLFCQVGKGKCEFKAQGQRTIKKDTSD